MKNLFVPYEIALKLKEKGFNEPCFAYYTLAHTRDEYRFHIVGERLDGYTDWYVNYVGCGLTNTELNRNPSGRLNKCFTAPIYQQVVDQFMEEHLIFINVKCEKWLHTFCGCIENDDGFIETEDTNDYYKAYDAAIIEAIELI